MGLNSFLVLLGTVLVMCYFYVRKKFSYWSDRGVPCIKPEFPMGNLKGFGTKAGTSEIFRDLHLALKDRKAPFCGVYFFVDPSVLVTDLDLIRLILVKDFQYFQDRGLYMNEKNDPLTANLVNLEGERWKNLRSKLTPTFTSGKLKFMHSTILLVADKFKDHLMNQPGNEIDIKELFAQFTTDIIGSVAFGLEVNSMSDDNSEFRRHGRIITSKTSAGAFKRILTFTFPTLSNFLGIRLNSKVVENFFTKSIKETIEYREKNNVTRNDFFQLLMQLRDTGVTSNPEEKLTFAEMIAQSFAFFVGGFETSSSTMSFACFELAHHPEIQEKVREELKEVLERHDGVLSYDAVMELRYLDKVVNETLRKYPIASVIRRKCTKDYKVPGTEMTIEKGMIVLASALGIQYDPDIYPDPHKFDPERFTKEAIASRHPFSYLPFGKGPRECIGMRFALMQTKVGLATVLKTFKLFPTEKTRKEIKFNPTSRIIMPLGGVWLGIEKV